LDRFIKASGFVPKGELEYVEEGDTPYALFVIQDRKHQDKDAGYFTNQQQVEDAVKQMNEETEPDRFHWTFISTYNQWYYQE
jgi:hypothetical protein